ncbi:MAG: hypothetical protein U0793_24525 [Gemmataceae bacterium]
MLESRGLIVGPWGRFEPKRAWAHAAPPGAWTRIIADAASGATLGFAAWRRSGPGFLAGWFGERQIEVFESEDASFLLSLSRGFWRNWTVFDAEEQAIGAVFRGVRLQLRGEGFARLRQRRSPDPGGFVDRLNQTVARASRHDGSSWLVSFLDMPLSDPFARMVVLAAVLSWAPEPD